MRNKGVWCGVFVGLIVGLTLGSILAGPAEDRKAEMMEDFFRPLAWLVNKVDTHYVEEVDYDDLLEGATQGLLSTLDDYSSYLPPEMSKEFKEDTRGEFGGLGIQINFLPLKKVVRVEQPIPGTPAFKAGVLAGDFIIRIREESTGKVTNTSEFKNIYDAVHILRGKVGTRVTITVVHGEGGDREDITIKRGIIKIPGVRAAEIIDPEHGIGYVYIPHFHARMVRDLKGAMAELLDKGVKGVVIDLRFNPGGLLDAAREMADLFLEEDLVIVSTRGRDGRDEHVLTTRRGEVYPGLAVAVLVNRSSASASEIVAAALKDHARAVVVGESTFGKASVQNLFDCPDDKGTIKLTVARYYTPNGVLIQDRGVKPHVELKLSDKDYRRLARHIAEKADFATSDEEDDAPPDEEPGEPGGEGPAELEDYEPAEPEAQEPAEGEGDEETEEGEEEFEDVQLARALGELFKIMSGELTIEEMAEPVEADNAEPEPAAL